MTIAPIRLGNSVTRMDGLRRNFELIEQWITDASGMLNGSLTVAWSDITGAPTTLAGYGITSPLPLAQGGTAGVEALDARANLEVPRVTVSEFEPGDTVAGDIWHIPSTHLTYIFDGSAWYDMSGVVKP